jgi:cold shock CspA family protein
MFHLININDHPKRPGLGFNSSQCGARQMQTPPQVDFQGLSATPQIQDAIARHIEQLEERWGRITACRVVVKGPGERHREGGLYEVHIRLALPEGREVNVARTPPEDERHSDLTFAIDDAFRHARRQLQDRARRVQGQVKHHEGQPTGTVVQLDPLGEFGLLQTADGREVYFHCNSVLGGGFSRLQIGSRVAFVEEAGDKGAQASTVRILDKHALRA